MDRRHPEHGHHGVADELLDAAAVALDDALHPLEVRPPAACAAAPDRPIRPRAVEPARSQNRTVTTLRCSGTGPVSGRRCPAIGFRAQWRPRRGIGPTSSSGAARPTRREPGSRRTSASTARTRTSRSTPQDLELLATVAFMLGRDDDCVAWLERGTSASPRRRRDASRRSLRRLDRAEPRHRGARSVPRPAGWDAPATRRARRASAPSAATCCCPPSSSTRRPGTSPARRPTAERRSRSASASATATSSRSRSMPRATC